MERLTPADQEALRIQQLRDLGHRGPPTAAIYIAVVGSLWLGEAELRALGLPFWGPASLVVVASLLRTWVCLRLVRVRARLVPPLGRLFAGLSLAAGVAWSVMTAVALHQLGPTPLAFLIVCMTVGLIAGGLGSIGIWPQLYATYTVLVLGALSASLMLSWSDTASALTAALALVGYGAFMLTIGRRQFREYWGRLETNLILARQTRALEEARRAAEAATRAKSEFLAAMSHEIRTPMNGVLGVAELLKESPLSAEQQELVRTLEGSGQALLRVINDILDFSKVEAGRMELERVAFDPAECVEATAELLAPAAQAKGLELDLWIDPAVPPVHGDPGRVRQVLLNLAGNAVKFTPSGGVTLELRAVVRDGEVELRFSVRDTGVGLDEGARARLFQPFSQADASISRRHGGTGLGLAICQRLVHLMDGEIGFESELGRGSTFWFQLRLPRAADQAAPRPLSGVTAVFASRPAVRKELLALVERAGGAALEWSALPAEHPTGVTRLLASLPAGGGEQAGALRSWALAHREVQVLAAVPRSDVVPQRAALLPAVHRILARPLRKEALLATLGPASTHRARPLPDEAPIRWRILVVEDNATNQMLARRFLERAGFECGLADSGLAGLSALEREAWDAVLMDCQMPGMDGLETTAEIRRRERRRGAERRLPIIAMTANALEEDRRRALAAGMDAYLTKPIQAAEMNRVLRSLLEAQPGIANLPERPATAPAAP